MQSQIYHIIESLLPQGIPFMIKQTIQIENLSLIRFNISNRNIICVNEKGEFVWQIQNPYPEEVPGGYSNMYFNEQGMIHVFHTLGWEFILSLTDGTVTKNEYLK